MRRLLLCCLIGRRSARNVAVARARAPQPIFAIRPNAIGDITPRPGQESNDFVAWSSTRGGSFTPTPVVYGDYLYSINVSGISSGMIFIRTLRHLFAIG
jgi:hypothetical protein